MNKVWYALFGGKRFLSSALVRVGLLQTADNQMEEEEDRGDSGQPSPRPFFPFEGSKIICTDTADREVQHVMDNAGAVILLNIPSYGGGGKISPEPVRFCASFTLNLIPTGECP